MAKTDTTEQDCTGKTPELTRFTTALLTTSVDHFPEDV
jgi:hypothetical protein